MRNYFSSLLLLFCFHMALGQDYEKAWDALNNHNNQQAAELFKAAQKNPKTAVDAYFSDYFLQVISANDHGVDHITSSIYDQLPEPNSYVYACWFDDMMLGNYGAKSNPNQLKLIKKLTTDPKINGSLKAAASYQLGIHYFFLNKFKESNVEKLKLGSVMNWSFVGPFDNISECGFNKDYEPIKNPSFSAVFKSARNSDISWFTPAVQDNDGWTSPGDNINYNPAIIYGQSFLLSDKEQDVQLGLGATGSVKVWINDKLVLASKQILTTELDYYKQNIHLNKGYNRILVQLGNTDSNYPNFIIRIIDENGNLIPNLSATAELQNYTPASGAASSTESFEHFAESYFKSRVAAEPENLINYLLLNRCYKRNDRTQEGLALLEPLVKKYPKNEVLLFEYLTVLLNSKNSTKILEYVDVLRKLSPDSYLAMELKLNELMEAEKTDEAEALLNKQIEKFGLDEPQYKNKINLCIKSKNYSNLIMLVEEAHKKFPSNVEYTNLMYAIQKEVYKNNAAALKVYEDYLKKQFNYKIMSDLADAYTENGKNAKALALLEKYRKILPTDVSLLRELCKSYYTTTDYATAEVYALQALAQEPYSSTNLENLALIQLNQNRQYEAIGNYKKSIAVNPNNFGARETVRKLEDKVSLRSYFQCYDLDELYDYVDKNKVSESKNASSFILDWKEVLLYPEGPHVDVFTYAIQIHNSEGIERWKEISLPYTSTQELNVEKAELIKSNGTKIPVEQNYNELVFSKLEVGDIIVIRYSLSQYVFGRLGQKFWDSAILDSYYDTKNMKYTLMIPKGTEMRIEALNTDIQPTTKEIESEFTLYTWERSGVQALEQETYMPPMSDVSPTIFVSTVKTWDDIADWYSDITSTNYNDDIDVKRVFDELSLGSASLSELEKAERIYNYIHDNVKYSSVAFRQSRYVPQTPSKTINTKLGDCKDMSSLFVVLADMAGLKSQLVLVDTRDNGYREMPLPSVEFNHCIVKLNTTKSPIYLELTDNKLPFGAVPTSLIGSMALEIPKNQKSNGAQLFPIPDMSFVKNVVKRTGTIDLGDSDIQVKMSSLKIGEPAGSFISSYLGLSESDRTKKFKEIVSEDYRNPVNNFALEPMDLRSKNDSVKYNYSYLVANEVTQIGELNTYKPNFIDYLWLADRFSLDSRKFPVETWHLADAEYYLTELTVNAPKGKKFVNLPKNQTFKYKQCTYTITYKTASPGTLKISREITLPPGSVSPAEYAEFKSFISKVSKADSNVIAWN